MHVFACVCLCVTLTCVSAPRSGPVPGHPQPHRPGVHPGPGRVQPGPRRPGPLQRPGSGSVRPPQEEVLGGGAEAPAHDQEGPQDLHP